MSIGVSLPIHSWLEHDEQLLRVRLSRPKANIIDARMIAALKEALEMHWRRSNLLGVILDAEGPHFSFGASVEEHLPERCATMLANLHDLILRLLDYPAPVLVAVRGQCLGGGLELACAGSMIFAAPESFFGQPEIKLGVFAPAASCLLPERIGQGAAEDLLLSGRTITAAEAHTMGLIAALADDPEAAALEWFEKNLAPRSAAALRYALRAARGDYVERVRRHLMRVEGLYLGEMMSTRDAIEGLDAFLAKRAARWEHR
jgi:cyclohexa-1,5-dienecarbonyl-CoA hydratase